jgi:tetratricopeptide (TPR) repeat protein
MKEQYMKKVIVMVLLAFAIAAIAQQPTQPSQPTQPTATGQGQGATTPANQKVIKDPAEYNAYITALNMTDPAQKAAAMEAFVKQYPQSVVFVDALEQAMAAYQQLQNAAKVEDTAKRILQIVPNNIRALAIVVALDRQKATSGDKAALQEGCGYTQKGIQELPNWQKSGDMSDAEFQKLKTQMGQIFNGAAGFCALNNKDYINARNFYLKAIQTDPNDLQDTYQLAISYLETDPIDLRGFWYGAKALSLAGSNAAAVNAIAPYIKGKFKKYHGKVEDWDQFAATTTGQTAPPPPEELAKLITPAPTPCDFAIQAEKDNPPDQLSFSDKEFILSKANCSPANKAAADRIWQSILTLEKNGEARLEIPVKVISATTDSMEVAVSDDNQAANKADMHVDFEKPVTKPPAPGTMTKVVGVITKYVPEPFMFTMDKGALPAAKTPPRRTPVRKKKRGK